MILNLEKISEIEKKYKKTSLVAYNNFKIMVNIVTSHIGDISEIINTTAYQTLQDLGCIKSLIDKSKKLQQLNS